MTETECSSTTEEKCETAYEEQCSTVYDQQCNTVPGQQQCTTVNEQVSVGKKNDDDGNHFEKVFNNQMGAHNNNDGFNQHKF